MNNNFMNRPAPRPAQNERAGMSDMAWDWVLKAVEFIGDLTKSVMVVGGIIAANLADFVMGSIAVTSLVNASASSLYKVPAFGFGSIVSMGASAIQIYMWSLIQKRGITIKQIFHPKTLPKDIQGFLLAAGLLWVFDTTLDLSPLALLMTNQNYVAFPDLYKVLVGIVAFILLILCGFAEILTSNMRSMLQITGLSKSQDNLNKPKTSYNPRPSSLPSHNISNGVERKDLSKTPSRFDTTKKIKQAVELEDIDDDDEFIPELSKNNTSFRELVRNASTTRRETLDR